VRRGQRERVDVTVIGHLDKTIIVRGDQRTISPGGAVYYGGLVLAWLGLRVAVVTRLAVGDAGLLHDFRRVGAAVYPIFTNETTSIENVLDSRSDKRTCYQRAFAGTFQPEDLPPVEARLQYVGTVSAGEVDLHFLRAVASRGPMALDVQGCLRKVRRGELVTADWPEADQVLPMVRYLKVDDREAFALTGRPDRREAARELAQAGPTEVVLTSQEGVLVLADGEFHEAPFRPRSTEGRTGRGDTCFAAYLGRRLVGDDPSSATKFAAAVTTLKLERPGPFRGSWEEVRLLMEQA